MMVRKRRRFSVGDKMEEGNQNTKAGAGNESEIHDTGLPCYRRLGSARYNIWNCISKTAHSMRPSEGRTRWNSEGEAVH